MCTRMTTSGVLCGLAVVLCVWSVRAQDLQYDSAVLDSGGGRWTALDGLYALLAQHDALGGHALARKSVRSPSRRLRFGRRSDPDMAPRAPVEEVEELVGLRETRAPVRLRFGRRSDERLLPHIFPREEQDRDTRTPSIRLRFGRSDNMFVLPFEQSVPEEVKVTGSEEMEKTTQE